jgi:hypothetical protein
VPKFYFYCVHVCVGIDDWVALIIIMVQWWQMPTIIFILVHGCKQGKISSPLFYVKTFTSSHKTKFKY